MKRTIVSVTLSGVLALAGATVHAQVIDFTGGVADWTFFYDSGSDSWDVVFRDKGAGTEATGVTNQADQSRFGADAGDHNFDTLNVRLGQPPSVSVNSLDYFVTSTPGEANNPDLGFRTRLREDADTDQFANFTITLDWATSIRPAGAEFTMFTFDGFGNPVPAYETAANDFVQMWDAWGHSHWHWGFTEPGDYSLNFTFQGQREDLSLSSVGATTVNFEVIPEPSTIALLAGVAALGFVMLRRRMRKET